MNIFDLHRDVLADYRNFVRSFLTIADERASKFVDDALENEARLWPDFLVQVSPSYATGRPALFRPRGRGVRFVVFGELHTIAGARERTWPC